MYGPQNAHAQTQINHHWQPIYKQKHQQTHIISIIIISVLRGKHLLLFGWYLPAQSPRSLHLPLVLQTSLCRQEWFVQCNWSVSFPITKLTDLWHHRCSWSNNRQQQCPIQSFFQITCGYFSSALWHIRCMPWTVCIFKVNSVAHSDMGNEPETLLSAYLHTPATMQFDSWVIFILSFLSVKADD